MITTNEINVLFILDSREICEMKSSWETVIEKVCNEFVKKKKLNRNSLLFKYSDEKIDLNKKFIDIANEDDKNCSGLSIMVYTGNPLKINFIYQNKPYQINCFIEDKIKDIFQDFASKHSDIKNLNFYYEKKLIPSDSNSIFKQIINKHSDNSTIINLEPNESISSIDINNINEINIIVEDKNNNPDINKQPGPEKENQKSIQAFFQKNKKKIIIISTIFFLLIIGFLTVYFVVIKNNKEKNNSSNISSKCGNGYFIPDDDETHQDCQKCSLEGCQKCNGTYNKNECISCGNLQSIYRNNKIIKCNGICEIGEDEKFLIWFEDKIE